MYLARARSRRAESPSGIRSAPVPGRGTCFRVPLLGPLLVTPLHDATFRVSINPAVVVALLEAGADANARSQGGLTPLHLAVRNSSEAILILLDAGAEVDARTEDGWTPLHFACGSSPAAALVLLAAGADVNAQDEDGQTPLYRAVAPLTRPVSPTLIGALLAAGAWVNTPGNSPLHHAARFADNPAVIEALLSAGADASARDSEGKTPWDHAQENEALRGTDAWWRFREGGLD
ncbi:MAG: ankyrin repeat domain-containing protein [Truepera sp.]|nr:ankyrin repeat domain-containing protein [Truepera sp.]